MSIDGAPSASLTRSRSRAALLGGVSRQIGACGEFATARGGVARGVFVLPGRALLNRSAAESRRFARAALVHEHDIARVRITGARPQVEPGGRRGAEAGPPFQVEQRRRALAWVRRADHDNIERDGAAACGAGCLGNRHGAAHEPGTRRAAIARMRRERGLAPRGRAKAAPPASTPVIRLVVNNRTDGGRNDSTPDDSPEPGVSCPRSGESVELIVSTD